MTGDEVLRLMEEWHKAHKGDPGFDPDMPFRDFNGLLNADLRGVDLSSDAVAKKAEEYRRKNRGNEPPWRPPFSTGIDLRGANVSTLGAPANLRGAQFTGANFTNAKLQSAIFTNAELGSTVFRRAQLDGANFAEAKLQSAVFTNAELRGAQFELARLQEADFGGAHLQGAFLGTKLAEARLEDVAWENDYVLGRELDAKGDSYPGTAMYFGWAESEYRNLKQYYNDTGQYDLAGEFHRRELLMRRKRLWNIHGVRPAPGLWKWLSGLLAPLRTVMSWLDDRGTFLGRYVEALVLYTSAILMGHGERPSWVVGWVFACFAAFTAAYWLLSGLPETPELVESIRYGAQAMLSFSRNEDAAEWAQDAALVQSFISYVLLALFLVTFVRKVSPR